jgi:hypothetical protein
MGMMRQEPTRLEGLRTFLARGKRRLRAAHRAFVLQRTLQRIRSHDDYVPLSDRAVENLLYGWGNEWSLKEELITELWHRAWHTRGPVLECGSGLSTLLLGIAAERLDYEVYSLEHDESWHAKVSDVVRRLGLDHVKIIAAPLVLHSGYAWYDAPGDFPPDFSLVLCDGPPAATMGGRYGLLPELRPSLADDCVILLDDAARDGEQEVLVRWTAEHQVTHRMEGKDKPFAVVEFPSDQ